LFDSVPNRKTIDDAHKRIKPFIHKTPVLSCESINSLVSAELYFKCENFQKVGAFKFRGASNAILSLSESKRKKGVATHSSGNHAQAVALSAKKLGIPAFIVMPKTAPEVKVRAVEGYGANITFCEPSLADREETLKQVVENTGAHVVHPYNDYKVVAGQATCAKEFLEEYPALDYLVAPVGGGGLISGTALSAHYFSPKIVVIAAEPEGANDAWQSFKAGKIIPSVNPNTIADGLLTSLGDKTFPIIQKYVTEIVTVSDEAIVMSMRLMWERMKIIVEPSSAVPLAAVLKEKIHFSRKKVGIILTGGNVDLNKLPF